MITALIPTKTDKYIANALLAFEISEPKSAHKVIVGDNGLSHDAGFAASELGARLLPIPNPFNFSRAINALAHAAPLNSHLLIMNDDAAIASPLWSLHCERILSDDRFADYGLISLQIDGGVGNPDQSLKSHPLMPLDVLFTDKTVCFVAALVRREVWASVGPLDEQFVGYGYEDDDYCMRVRRAGWKIGVTGAAYVTHGQDGYPHSSTYQKLHGTKRWEELSAFNRQLFLSKWGVRT